MSHAVVAGIALSALVVLAGKGSAARLRPRAASAGGWSWPARTARPALAVAGVDVPASLALELRSGRDLSAAFAAVADELVEHRQLCERLREAGDSAETGDPVGPVLAGGVPPDDLGHVLQVTATCCDVSNAAGLPLAEILDTVAEEARARLVLMARAKAELAGARSTSVVLACLPVVGLAMGQLLGARPVHVLLATTWGAGCLLAALLLTGAGAAWSRAIRRSAERRLP